MPIQGKCPNPDCRWNYNVHDELKKNLSPHAEEERIKPLFCPFCQHEITSKISVCPHCGYIVIGNKYLKKSSAFLYLCLILILLSLLLKYSD
jgi:ribosomal protein L37AE/L43A